MPAATFAHHAGILSRADRGEDETRRDAAARRGVWEGCEGEGTRRGCRDEWEHVSRGCFCTGGSFNAITRATPGASPPSSFSSNLPRSLPLPPDSSPFPPPSQRLPPTISSPTNLLRGSYFIFIRFPSAPSLPPPPLAEHVIPHYFHFIVSNLG